MSASTNQFLPTAIILALIVGCGSASPATEAQAGPQKPSQAKLDEVRANAQRAFDDSSFGGPGSGSESRPEAKPAPAPSQKPSRASVPTNEARQDSSDVLMKAQGISSTESSAQKVALAELSRLIVVEIESQFESMQQYSDGKTKSEITDANKVASKGFFTGVKYVTLSSEQGRVTVEAQFTQQSASDTVNNLQQDLGVDLLNEKKKTLQKLAEKAIFLRALSVLLGPNFDSSQGFAESRREEIMKLLAQTRINLELKPTNATMEVDGKTFQNGDVFFLRPGKHNWRVGGAANYEDQRGEILATKGDRKNLSIELIPRGQPGWQSVKVDEPKRAITSELGRYGYQVSADSALQIRFSVKVDEVNVSGYTKFTIRGRIEGLNGDSVVHVVKATTSFSTKSGTTKGKADAKIEKLGLKLLERFLVEHAEEFFAQ